MKVVHQVQNILSQVHLLGASLSKKRHIITVQTDSSTDESGSNGALIESVEVSLVAAGKQQGDHWPDREPSPTRRHLRRGEQRTQQRHGNNFENSKRIQFSKKKQSSTPSTVSSNDDASSFSEFIGSGVTHFSHSSYDGRSSVRTSSSSSVSESSPGAFSGSPSGGSSYDVSSSGSSSSDSGERIPPATILATRDIRKGSATSAVSHLRPFAGSTTEEVVDEDDLTPLSDDVLQIGQPQPKRKVGRNEREVMGYLRWRPIPGQSLKVRSAHYLKTRQKQPSIGELYECLRVDMIKTPHRLAKISSRVELPELDEDHYRTPKTWDAPDTFVVTLSIPLEKKGDTENKPCITLSFYFGMKAKTRDILARITGENATNEPKSPSKRVAEDDLEMVNAVRLFNTWCQKAPNDPAFQGRFKLIPFVKDLEGVNLPSWMNRWNGAPVLIKRSGKTGILYNSKDDPSTMDDSVMEMEISFHPFPWVARQAIDYLREKIFSKVLLTFGFLIEARAESELPEVLIGLAQLGYPRAELAVPSHEFFQ
ncbi:hypothetical protein ACA910_007830 [Epithemia clementina (nom. ined.)]